MAAETRYQERIEAAYMDLLAYLSHHRRWAESVRPLWGPIERPSPIEATKRDEIEARVTAFGSPRVRQLLNEWTGCAKKIENADQVITSEETSDRPSPELQRQAVDEHNALPSYKHEMFAADDRIRQQVYAELAGTHNGREDGRQGRRRATR